MIFVADNFIFGGDNMRVVPFLFSIASAVLLYFVVRNRIDKERLRGRSVFFYFFYNILGSLSPDVDGAILPFFFLLAVYAYDRSMSAEGSSARWKWISLLITSLLVGFLIKLSFILVIGVILADYVWSRGKKMNSKEMLISFLGMLGFGLVYVALLYGIKFVYPSFDMSIMMGHANQFREEEARNWIQVFVQGLKAIYYLSPLLIIPIFFINKDILKRQEYFSSILF